MSTPSWVDAIRLHAGPDEYLRAGQVIEFPHDGHELWRVHYVNDCAAYIRPVSQPNAESIAIGNRSLSPRVATIQMGEESIMPTVTAIETGIEKFALDKVVRPLAEKLREIQKGIQTSAVAKAFNNGHDSDVAAFANRIADGVYDAVVTILEETAAAAPAKVVAPLVEQLKASLAAASTRAKAAKGASKVAAKLVLAPVANRKAAGAVAAKQSVKAAKSAPDAGRGGMDKPTAAELKAAKARRDSIASRYQIARPATGKRVEKATRKMGGR